MPAGHEVHVLNGLRRRSLEEVVEAGDDDKAAAIGGELEANVAEGCANDVLDLRQHGRRADADHGGVDVEIVEAGLNGGGGQCFVEAHVDGGKDAAGDGEKVRRELELVGGQVELLEHLSGVAMAKDGVGRKVVGGVHEVGVGGGRFASSADAGFGVADDAAIEVDEIGAEQGSQRENDGRGVAAGVGYEAGLGDGRAVELGGAVDGFGLQGGGGGGVFEIVDGSVAIFLEPPCGGEIDDANAMSEGLGSPLAGLLMRRGEEKEINRFSLELFPVKRDDGEAIGVGEAGELGVKGGEGHGCGFRFGGSAAEENGWRGGEARVEEEEAREFSAGVSGDSGNGCAEGWDGGGIRQCEPRSSA